MLDNKMFERIYKLTINELNLKVYKDDKIHTIFLCAKFYSSIKIIALILSFLKIKLH